MSDLDKVLDQLVAGDEASAKETFHNMLVQQSRDEWNKLQPQDTPQDQPVQEAVDESALRAWYDKYSKYEGTNNSNLVLGMIKAWTDTGILSDAYEDGEWADYLNKLGKDSDELSDEEFDAFLTPENAPISYGMQANITKIMGEWDGEETMNKVDDMLQSMGIEF